MMRSLALVCAGLLLAVALWFGVGAVQTARTQLTAGTTAYGWLASPAAPDSPDVRAKVLEDLIAAELARRGTTK
jgi:hypothetical protein